MTKTKTINPLKLIRVINKPINIYRKIGRSINLFGTTMTGFLAIEEAAWWWIWVSVGATWIGTTLTELFTPDSDNKIEEIHDQ
jgi:hypothetical protein